ncbi:urocanate reductase [Enterococcus sp. AZ194]|uniref:flavocytochrome c n=1 Tax=Enterococcus sp. AZ194 TaxID=2774629 RepID=UPI003F24D20D
MKKSVVKKIMGVAIVFLVVLLAGCSAKEDSKIKDGTFSGSSNGNGGEIEVQVVLKDGKITEVNTLKSQETKGLGEDTLEQIREAIVENNSVHIEALSGATASSEGYIAAVKDALKKAGATDKDFVTDKKITLGNVLDKEEYTFDVLVVGAGGAGLSSAVEASSAGASVAVLEKSSAIGGNTAVSGGAFNVPGSDLQKNMGIEDSKESFVEDALKGGDNIADPKLVQVVADHALEAYEWMRDDIKAEFIQDRVQQFGGHSVPRSVVPVGNKGVELTNKLWEAAKGNKAELFLDTKAVELIEKDGKIVGVKAENNGKTVTFHANKGVVLASGGFAADVEMRKKYNSHYDEKFMTTAVSSSTGDGIVMGEQAGAGLVDMKEIQVYPTSNPETGIISYVANSRFDGAILVNQGGQRFVNEGGRRDDISNAILDQENGYAYLVWGQEIETVGNMTKVHEKEFEEMKKNDILFECSTLSEAAEKTGVDAKTLEATVKQFNGYVKDEKDPDFEKTGVFNKIEEGPFYIQKVVPSTHHTMGGLTINTDAQVLDTDGKAIPNLYAAGEVTGGIHGTNRLGGNAITDIIVFGRIAGSNVAK